MKKLFLLFSAILVAVAASACTMGDNSVSHVESASDESSSLWESVNDNDTQSFSYSFEDYACEEITDIMKIETEPNLGVECESFQFKFTSDGNEIMGFISIPTHCIEEHTPSKALIYNRGGNFQYGSVTCYDTAMICSYSDRIVISAEYRGSEGCTGLDEFGGDDVNDVLTLIDIADTKLPFINMDDFTALGISRGGMMAYLAARQNNRIKRIVAISAVSDLAQAYNEREDIQLLLHDCISGTPEEMPEEYEKRSVYCWADEIKIPTLIIHSKGDELVSYSQSEKLYNKFKENGNDTTLISHDDSLHGPHTEDYEAIVEWLNG